MKVWWGKTLWKSLGMTQPAVPRLVTCGKATFIILRHLFILLLENFIKAPLNLSLHTLASTTRKATIFSALTHRMTDPNYSRSSAWFLSEFILYREKSETVLTERVQNAVHKALMAYHQEGKWTLVLRQSEDSYCRNTSRESQTSLWLNCLPRYPSTLNRSYMLLCATQIWRKAGYLFGSI